MVYKLLADAAVLLHLLWIVFLVLGLVWAWRWPRAAYVHLAGLGLVLVLNLGGWYCPLTDLEVYLRSLHRPEVTYQGSLAINYLERIVYPDLPETLLRRAAVLWAVLNLAGYALLARKRLRRRRESGGGAL